MSVEMTKKQKVFVGLSGGVDSSVAALRLLKEGYDVVGVFIKVWQPDFLKCDWEAERLDAMRVAAHLKIPFLTCDAVEAYKNDVGQYFIKEYIAGRTPNPDVMCNQYVKFGVFLEFAESHGADFIATGHYASLNTINENIILNRGIDNNKDQSYFLWAIKKQVLKKVLLPIGVSTKDEIRAEAKTANLPTAIKKDSQGVCFLGHIDIPEFIGHFTELKSGLVLNTENEIIGEHQGALVYTIGQRHGFTIKEKTTDLQPYYVIKKDIPNNTLIVSHTPPETKIGVEINLQSTNWISVPIVGKTYTAQFRYRQSPIPVELTALDTDTALIKPLKDFSTPDIGQSCVIYDGENCLGGGIISL